MALERSRLTLALKQLRPRYVRNVMTSPLITISPHTSGARAERLAVEHQIHHLPVAESGRLLGVMCLCDLWSAGSDAREAGSMASPAATIDFRAPLREAVEAIREQRLGCLPVVEGSALVGIVTRGDLCRAGFLGHESIMRTCAACSVRRHVHNLLDESTVAFCVECVDRGRAADFDDPFEELGGGG